MNQTEALNCAFTIRLGERLASATKIEKNEAMRPTDEEVDAAARVLFKAGQFHHWWPESTKTYDELATTDPIGKDEFDAIVERVLIAASMAGLGRTPRHSQLQTHLPDITSGLTLIRLGGTADFRTSDDRQ